MVAMSIRRVAISPEWFDIEKSRPATLVLVPEDADHGPQVLGVEPAEYEAMAGALVTIGRRLAESA